MGNCAKKPLAVAAVDCTKVPTAALVRNLARCPWPFAASMNNERLRGCVVGKG